MITDWVVFSSFSGTLLSDSSLKEVGVRAVAAGRGVGVLAGVVGVGTEMLDAAGIATCAVSSSSFFSTFTGSSAFS